MAHQFAADAVVEPSSSKQARLLLARLKREQVASAL
jgi:hypothetical protein